MISLLLLGGIVAQEVPFLMQVREDAIYSLRGGPDALREFHKQVGTVWTGGEVVDLDPADGIITYWAYSDRSAAESRALLLPAIQYGLTLAAEEYREGETFPRQREALNKIAEKCEASMDPFFVTPHGTVEVSVVLSADPEIEPCLMSELEKSEQIDLAAPRANGGGK